MADNGKKNTGNIPTGGSRQNVSRRLEARKKKKRKRIIRTALIAVAAVVVFVIGFFVIRAVLDRRSSQSAAPQQSASVSGAGQESVTPGGAAAASSSAPAKVTAAPTPTPTATPTPEPLAAVPVEIEEKKPADLKMSFTGDFILGTDEGFAYETGFPYYYDNNGPDYFMDNVREIFEKDDLTVINFEGTLTNETAREYKEFAFKGDPAYIDIIKNSSIEAANLANNHSADYGEQSYLDTVNILEENGITHFGYEDVAVLDVKGYKVGIFGVYELDQLGWVAPEVTACMDKLKAEQCDLIIAVFHWGTELQQVPDGYQVELAHQAIDEGADLVIGHHPHVLQGIEYYNGKTICYSLGNFCFGGNYHPTEMDTIIFQQTFHMDSKGKITGTDINVIPCCVSSTWEFNDYKPTVMTGEDAKSIMEKLDYRSELITWNYGTETVYNSASDGTVGFTFGEKTRTEGSSEAGDTASAGTAGVTGTGDAANAADGSGAAAQSDADASVQAQSNADTSAEAQSDAQTADESVQAASGE